MTEGRIWSDSGTHRADRCPDDDLPWLLLLSLTYGPYVFILVVSRHLGGGITETEEWRLYIEGWLLSLPIGIGAALLAGAALGRSNLRPFLCLINAAALGATIALLRWGPGAWDGMDTPALWILPVTNAVAFALVLLVHPAGLASRLLERAARFLAPLLLIAAALGGGLSALPPAALLPPAVAFAAISWLLVRLERRFSPPPALLHLADALVLLLVVLCTVDLSIHDQQVHHQNFYLGPTNDVLHGKTVLIDTVSQYGVLLIYFLAASFDAISLPPSYWGMSAILCVLQIVQCIVLYGILRFTTRSVVLSVAALALVLVCGGVSPNVVHPSSGPLRFFPPYAVLGLVAVRMRYAHGVRSMGLAEAAVIGIASLWSVETFVYTAVAYGAVVVYDTIARARTAGGAMRALGKRLLAALAGILVAHALLAAFTYARAGEWPHWEYYIPYLMVYSSIQQLMAAPAPPWSEWVIVVAIYFASLAGCLFLLPAARREVDGRLALLFGLTALGALELTYYLGPSTNVRLVIVFIPAILPAAAWLAEIEGRRVPRATRGALFVFALVGAGLAASATWPSFAAHLEHLPLHLVTRRFMGGPSRELPGAQCLHGDCLYHGATAHDALELISRYARDEDRVTVLLEPEIAVEVHLRAGKPDVFPIAHLKQASYVRSNFERAVHFDHGLRAGDVFIVNERSFLNSVGRAILSRLCREFTCDVIERGPSGVAAIRLLPAGSRAREPLNIP